jgi:hypothetical protein
LKAFYVHNTAECDETSDFELKHVIEAVSSRSPISWHGDLDQLSISEGSTSEEDSEIKELDRSSDDMDASQATHVHDDDVASDPDRVPTGGDFPVHINTSKQALAELHHGGFSYLSSAKIPLCVN